MRSHSIFPANKMMNTPNKFSLGRVSAYQNKPILYCNELMTLRIRLLALRKTWHPDLVVGERIMLIKPRTKSYKRASWD